jgi:hypothetical protein
VLWSENIITCFQKHATLLLVKMTYHKPKNYLINIR